ncbi:MAG: ERF family protein [Solirubrobacteraceae bacterium]
MTVPVNVVKGGFGRTSGQPDPLAKKVAEVMAEVEGIQKRGEFRVGQSRDVRYKYVQATDLYEAVRDKLASRGIVFVARFGGIEFEKEKPTSGGGSMYTVGVRVNLELRDSETGTSIYADWLGVGQDMGDKAVAKAFTGAVKTWLMTTFLVPSDVDPDHPAETGAKRRASARKQTEADRKTMAGLLKAYIRAGRRSDDEAMIRLRLTTLGVKDVADFNRAVIGLDQAKAVQLMQWLGDEIVKRQGEAKS